MAENAKALQKSYSARLQKAVQHHAELLQATSGKKRQAALETMLCEQFALNIMVLWEVFLSDLLIHYLSMDPKKFTADLKTRLQQSVKDKFGGQAASMITFSPPASVSLAKARSLADHKNFNLTANSANELTQVANRLLQAKYAKQFTLDPDDAAFFDYTVALRNYLAHRSKSSQSILKSATAKLAGANAALKAPIGKIGPYLKFKDAQQQTRAAQIAFRMQSIALKLA